MNKTYINLFRARGWTILLSLVTMLGIADLTHAQQGSSGNTYIFGGAEMTFFGNHDFANGGSGALPGTIGTVRTGPFGILNFASAASHNGGSDVAHVDGYVRKLGTTPFVFPVGDDGFYGPFAASGDGTMGAYYHGDASVAVTSDLGGGNYPVLPLGGPFPTTSIEDAVDVVSTVEYWDIDGSNATPVTLTWDAGSSIGTLTGNQLNKLTIVGWDGTQWVAIPSVVDINSVLGGASDLTAGSISTTAAIIPNSYTAYTLASRDAPLPVKLARFNVIKEGNTAILSWSTTEETNSDRFEVERRSGDNQWKLIGTTISQGESSVLVDYEFVDSDPLTGGKTGGENLYRLRMVDKDGTFAYSRVRSVRFGDKETLILYPNPTSEKLFVKGLSKVRSLSFVDMNGSVVHQTNIPASGEVNVGKLASGLHILQITWLDGTMTTTKLVIRK